jgi:hypothetical protein
MEVAAELIEALLKADREKEIEQYGKQVSMRPSKVHRLKKTTSGSETKKLMKVGWNGFFP